MVMFTNYKILPIRSIRKSLSQTMLAQCSRLKPPYLSFFCNDVMVFKCYSCWRSKMERHKANPRKTACNLKSICIKNGMRCARNNLKPSINFWSTRLVSVRVSFNLNFRNWLITFFPFPFLFFLSYFSFFHPFSSFFRIIIIPSLFSTTSFTSLFNMVAHFPLTLVKRKKRKSNYNKSFKSIFPRNNSTVAAAVEATVSVNCSEVLCCIVLCCSAEYVCAVLKSLIVFGLVTDSFDLSCANLTHSIRHTFLF